VFVIGCDVPAGWREVVWLHNDHAKFDQIVAKAVRFVGRCFLHFYFDFIALLLFSCYISVN